MRRLGRRENRERGKKNKEKLEKGKDKRVMKKKKRGTGWKQREEKARFMYQTWKTKAGGETTKWAIWVIGR